MAQSKISQRINVYINGYLIGTIYSPTRQRFLDLLKNFTPQSLSCIRGFSVKYTEDYVSGATKLYGIKNLLINFTPTHETECGAKCTQCIANGQCKNPVVREMIGKILLSRKYPKSKRERIR